MFLIAFNENCREKATLLANALEDARLVDMKSAIENPELLGDFDNLGLVYEQVKKAVSDETVSFIKNVLGSYDLSTLEYMFSICQCSENAYHSLKVVEKLCARIGCAPSLNITSEEGSDMTEVCTKIKNGDILLAKGSLGTMFFMKAHKIK